MKCGRNMRNKLSSRAGETIGETLVALLIAALALTMLAGAIMSSFNIIKKSRTTLNTYYNNTNNLATFSNSTGPIAIIIEGESCNIKYSENTFGDIKVISYKPE